MDWEPTDATNGKELELDTDYDEWLATGGSSYNF
jgi:hypothetical protein